TVTDGLSLDLTEGAVLLRLRQAAEVRVRVRRQIPRERLHRGDVDAVAIRYNETVSNMPTLGRIEAVHMTRPLSPADLDHAIELYLSGEPIEQIAANAGVSSSRLHRE